MKRIAIAAVFLFLFVGCGGGGSTGGDPIQGEAVTVAIVVPPGASSAAATRTAQPKAATVSVAATVKNVGTETVRGFILTNYSGAPGDSGADTLNVCQKCYDYRDGTGVGGCNYIFHLYQTEIDFDLSQGRPDPLGNCTEGRGAFITGIGWSEHAYMPEGDGYCDNPAEHPELDCARPGVWRVLRIPVMGNAGGGGVLRPGEQMAYGGGYTLPTGIYRPSAAVYRWDGALFDNDARTITVP